MIPDVLILSAVPTPTPVNADPSSAGNAPLKLEEATVPLKLDAVIIPLVLILPSVYAVKAIPASGPILRPSLNVLIPVASTLATSS